MAKGLFIVIEGAPGAGAASQLNLLGERLKAVGHDVELIELPRLGENSGHFVRNYLSGNYGKPGEVSSYTATLFYALDRYEASVHIKESLTAGKIVLASNYVGANMAEQGSKFADPGEQRGFFVWNDNLEYELMELPRPDLSLYLRLPADISSRLASDSGTQGLTELKKRLATYDLLCRLFPKDYKAIECSQNDQKKDLPTINNQIWEIIKPMLPAEKRRPSQSVIVTIGKEQDGFPALGNQENILRVPIKEGSVLLKLFMEQIRPGCTSPRLSSWSSTGYKLYKLGGKKGSLSKTSAALDELLKSYQLAEEKIRQKLSDKNKVQDLLLLLTPLASVTSFTLTIPKEDVQELTSRLLVREQPEAQWAAKQIYIAARQKWPHDFKLALEAASELTGKEGPVVAKLASEWLSADGGLEDRVKLLEALPRREFDLLAESIYPYSNLSLAEISEEVMEWPYAQKSQSLTRWLAQPGLLKKVCYRLDIISDLLTQTRIAEASGLRNVAVQPPGPRYGFDIPESVENLGLDDIYSTVFDNSLAAFSHMQTELSNEAASYAVLLGHKVRWQLQADAEQMLLIRKIKQADQYHSIIKEIEDKITDAHPLLWDILAGREDNRSLYKNKDRVKPARRRSGKPKRS